DQIAAGSTQRAGRLLAPLGVRFVVVPEFDGVVSRLDDPLPPPTGLTAAFDEQLDIVSRFSIPTVVFYENSAWIPTASLLTGPTADASRSAGADAIVRSDLSERTPVFVGVGANDPVSEDIGAGTVHLAVPFEDDWRLTVDGVDVPARRAFGTTVAFDVDEPGRATLSYSSPSARGWLVGLQLLLWFAVAFGAIRVTVSLARRRRQYVADETLLSLDDPLPGIDPGLVADTALDDDDPDDPDHDEAAHIDDVDGDADRDDEGDDEVRLDDLDQPDPGVHVTDAGEVDDVEEVVAEEPLPPPGAPLGDEEARS
ncbi:MAG: hypothetical protein AAFP84_18050, partial [Actinomycetota bacterium]